MNKSLFLIVTVFLTMVVSIGCSGSDQSPLEPSSDSLTGALVESNQSRQLNTNLLGYYDIYFDLETYSFESVLNRNASFTLNIVPFLNQMTIPMNGITFDSIVIHNDDPTFLGVDVEFSIYHPFPGYDQYNAYDIRGVLIGNGARVLEYDGLRTAEHGVDLWMKNPDGYTRWFNPTEFTTEMIFGYCPGGFQNLAGDAHLNPYKYYGKHLGKDDNLWSWLTDGPNFEGVFESGSGRTMELEFPMPPDGIGLMFGYAVVVCWEEQGPSGPYYPVHIPEPVAASVTQTPDVWFDGVDSGGNLILDIDLFAWEYQPSTVKIESSVLDGIAEFDYGTYASPGGEHYSTWHVEAPSGIFTGIEGHDYWVIAEYGGFDYKNGLPDIPSADGPLAAFFKYDAIVLDESPNLPPECDLQSDPPLDYEGPLPVTITFDANGTDPDPGDVLSYEWSENGTDWTPGDETHDVEYATEGFYSIYVQVTDSYGAMTECSIEDFEIAEVAPADPVEGNVELIVLRNSTYSITGVQLDWTGNSSPEYAVYADLDPYDGITPDTFIADTTSETIVIDSSNYDEFSTNACYAFTVRARSVAGNSSTESTDSEYAFVEMEDFDGGDDPYGEWDFFYQNTDSQFVIEPGPIDDNVIRIGPCPTSRWAAVTSKQLPAIADNEYSVMEIAQRTVNWQTKPWDEVIDGMYSQTTAGWATAPGTNGNGTYKEFMTPPLDAAIDGTWPLEDQLNPTSWLISIGAKFGGNSSTWRGWRITYLDYAGDPPPIRFTRLDMPHYRSESVVYAAYGFAIVNHVTPDEAYCDEIAVVIY